jgi:PAS domain S-box-containing protein
MPLTPGSETSSRLRTVLDTAVDGIILIDARGTVLMFNKACEKLFGYRAEDVVGQNVKLLMPSPFHEEHDRYLKNYLAGGKAEIIGIGREVTGRRKDGSTFPMDLSVGETKEGEEPIFVGVIHDLTERKQTEQATRELVSRLRAVVDTAVDGVILIDANGTIVTFNPACEKLFGYTADEVIGKNVRMLMPTPYREQHDRYLENYLRTGEAKIIGIGREVTGRRKDGSTFPMDLSVGEATQGGQSTFVGVIHDLTERNRTQEQLIQAQKMETVGQLSGGIAHDFNNLLTVIIGNAEILAGALKARQDLKELADMIGIAGSRGADLTQRLLAFSRRQTLKPVEIDCNHFISSMQEMLRRTLREDLDVRTVLEGELWPAFADPAQLESAILNLALNAQDAIPNGGCITISSANVPLDERYRNLHPEVPPGRYVMVAVTDDGQGMTREVLEKAFEPFFTTKEVGRGSGLGLSMVYGFVKQSNGHVTIYSEPALGTTVRMYLPATDERAAAGTSAAEAPATVDAPKGRGTVLVVEDDPFVRAYAVASVESLGYAALAAIDGRDALSRLADETTIDILFSDVVMPGGVNGLELATQALQLRPDLKVLLTSGYGLETLAGRGHLKPGTVVLHKPYRRAELAQRLRELEGGR